MMEVPKLEGNKLIFKVRQVGVRWITTYVQCQNSFTKKKKKIPFQDDGFSAFSGDERSVSSEDSAVLQWLRDKVETVLVLNMEDKPVPSCT